MAQLPDGEHNPYGDFTHTSANGKYKFEWTPFTPAIVEWRNAEGHLRRAAAHLAEARRLPSFAINGLGAAHDDMIRSLEIFQQDTEASYREADLVRRILEAANIDYARSNEASYEQYQQLMQALDAEHEQRRSNRAIADNNELITEARRDREVFPLDPVDESPVEEPPLWFGP
jgi:hypothetical protein